VVGNHTGRTEAAIRSIGANDMLIANNTLLGSRAGVAIQDTEVGCVIENNTFGLQGIDLEYPYHRYPLDTHRIDSTNRIGGYPILYLVNRSDIALEEDLGQVLMVGCHNVSMRSLDLKDEFVGIDVFYSDAIEFSQNKMPAKNGGHVDFYQTTGVEVNGNDLMNTGSWVQRCKYLNFTRNRMVGGSFLCDSGEQVRAIGNNISLVGGRGMEFHYGSHNEISDNVVNFSSEWQASAGIEIENTPFTKVSNNTLTGFGYNIHSYYKEDLLSYVWEDTNTLNGKPVLFRRAETGLRIIEDYSQIILWYCENWTIENQIIEGGHRQLVLTECVNGTIANNRLAASAIDCISTRSCKNVTIRNNTISHGFNGIKDLLSEDLIIKGNRIQNITNDAMDLESRTNVSIRTNIIIGSGRWGIHLTASDSMVSRNYIEGASWWGLDIFGTDCLIHHNTFIDNNIDPDTGEHRGPQARDYHSKSQWDDGSRGNYWSDYKDRYSKATNDGTVWDTPYLVEVETFHRYDRYPLVHPIDIFPPVADAGADVTVRAGDVVVLNAGGSTDNDIIVVFRWNFVYDNRMEVLTGKARNFVFEILGVYVVTLRVVDRSGHWDEDTLTVTVVEADPPRFIGIDVPSEVGTGQVLTISCQVQDATGVAQVWVVRWAEGMSPVLQNTSLELVDGVWTANIQVPEDQDTPLWYRLGAIDLFGSVRLTTEAKVDVVDIIPPTLTPLVTITEVATGGDYILNCSVTDNWLVDECWAFLTYIPAVVSYRVFMQRDGTDPELWHLEFSVPVNATDTLGVSFQAEDSSGNFRLGPSVELTVVDTISPRFLEDMTPDAINRGDKVEFMVALSDNHGIVRVLVDVRYDDDEWTEYQMSLLGYYANGTWRISVHIPVQGIVLHYRYRATDSASNWLETQAFRRTLLGTRPTITQGVTGTATIKEHEQWSFDHEMEDVDGTPGEETWSMETDASWLVIDAATGVMSGTPGEYEDGEYTVTVTVTDVEGYSDSYQFTIVVQEVPTSPIVDITSIEPGKKVKDMLVVRGTAHDEDGDQLVVLYRVDGGRWRKVSGLEDWVVTLDTSQLTPGTHMFEVQAEDLNLTDLESFEFEKLKENGEEDGGEEKPWSNALLVVAIVAVMVGVAVGVIIWSRTRRGGGG
jgi:hypothetical protein